MVLYGKRYITLSLKNKMMDIKKILNYTHHPITIFTQSGTVEIPKHGMARASTIRNIKDIINFNGSHIPLNETNFGNVTGLPEKKDDTIIIVSGITSAALGDARNDLFVVDEPVRDAYGKIIGCRALTRGARFNKE
jgi:hypothetical protein